MLKSFSITILIVMLFTANLDAPPTSVSTARFPASAFDICSAVAPNDRFIVQRRQVLIAGRCQENQDLCRTDEQCCSGLCGPEKRCRPTQNFKNINSGFCSLDDDCCSGLCEKNRCQGSNNYCSTIYGRCSQHEQCCSGLCSDRGYCLPSTNAPGMIGDVCSFDQQCGSGACIQGRCR